VDDAPFLPFSKSCEGNDTLPAAAQKFLKLLSVVDLCPACPFMFRSGARELSFYR
jgi:hypothetical protein